MTGLPTFDTTVQKSLKLVSQVQEEANIEDKHNAFQAMRITLQTLRDRLTVDEAAHVGAQLPNLIAGYYYEGWKPSSSPTKIRSRDEFLQQIRDYLQDVDPALDVDHTVRCVFKVLSRQVSEGQIEDVLQALPEELRELWPQHEKVGQ